MEFNKNQIKALEIYLKSKDKLLADPNYELSPEEIKARFIVENDQDIQNFLNDDIIKQNESIYSTRYIKTLDLGNQVSTNKTLVNQMGFANIILMSIIVIVLVVILFILIFL